MNTALSKAMNGEKVSDGQAKGALAEAVGKLKNFGGKISRTAKLSEAVADAVIATAETQGAVFAASFAEGYFGEEKMDLGPIDMRLGAGLALGGYGLYKSMTGKGSTHALALGNGLLATGIGRIGRHAGKALAEKKNAPATPPAAAATPAAVPATAGAARPQLAADDIGEIARMVRMTPGTEGESIEGRRRQRQRQRREEREEEEVSGRGQRFLRNRD
jgi:hypothetical protein